MNSISRFTGYLLILSIAAFSCGSPRHDQNEIEASMKYYNHLIEKIDADSIAMLYAPDGNLGDIAIGRDSIRHFLASFKNVRVLSQYSTTSSIEMKNDTAIQKGNYIQTDLLAGKDTVVVKGSYTARWEWIRHEGWRIKKMETKAAQ